MTQNGDAFDVCRGPWSISLGPDSTPDIILTTSKSHSFYPNIFSEVQDLPLFSKFLVPFVRDWNKT